MGVQGGFKQLNNDDIYRKSQLLDILRGGGSRAIQGTSTMATLTGTISTVMLLMGFRRGPRKPI